MFTKPPHVAPTVIRWLIIGTVTALVLLYLHAYYPRPYAPVQPVPFSHATHTAADKTAMDCRSCHAAATHATGAGLPSATSCLDCHRHLLADDERLQPLHAAAHPDHPAYTGEPLRWVRKAALPEGIFFHHGQHSAKGHSCEECHPDPDRQAPHSMRNCLDCHRKQEVPTNCDRCHH